MQRAWVIMVAAALGAAAIGSRPAAADVFGGTGARPETHSWTDSLKFWKSDPKPEVAPRPAPPSAAISPWRHPFAYMSATVAETPVAESWKHRNAEQQAASVPDSISLSTPTRPATPQYYIALAQLSERKGDIAQARTQLQEAIKKWPKDVESLRAAARMEDRQGQLQLAEMLYQRAVTVDPQNAGALNDLGLCLARQRKLPQSVQAMEQAIALQPSKALYRNNVATVLVEMHEDQRALAHLSAVHSPAEANYNLGQLLVDRGRPQEAVGCFQTALNVDPTMECARLAIAQLNGTMSGLSQIVVEGPAMQTQQVAPSYDQQYAPQPPTGEPSFPSTARGPAFGTSSYVPPSRYYPTNGSAPVQQAPAYQAPAYQTATAPRYLPPVSPTISGAVSGGAVVR
jgi:tetratricopeptide (TPR) repeat protein